MKKSTVLVVMLATFLLLGISVKAEPVISSCGQNIYLVGSTLLAEVCLKNTGTSMTEANIIELSPRTYTFLSWVSSQKVCDPTYPQNVHKEFFLLANEQETITLEKSLTAGTYDVFLISADSCCPENPQCQAKSPYGWGTYITTVQVSGYKPVCPDGKCEGYENPGNCPQDCHGYCGDGFCEPSERGTGCLDCKDDLFKDVIDFLTTYYLYVIGIIIIIVGAIMVWRWKK